MVNLPSAKYLDIQNSLLKKIKNGTYPEGELIPKEVDLAEELGVSRPTVRHAIGNLVAAGYLERRKKRGTIVKHAKLEQQFTHVIESYNDEIANNGSKAKTKVLSFKIIKPSDEVKSALDLQDTASVYQLVRLRFADEKPIVLVTTYLPVHPLPDLEQTNFEHASLYQTLAKANLAITHVKRKLEVHAATQDESQLLQIHKFDPVFYFHTVGSTSKGKKLEYSIATYRGDKNYFVIDINQTKRL